nr:LysR family transcriptional regulator [Massilia sp. Se16.2.3]
MLNSDDLRFFCAVASQPTLAATARLLHVTPPSVTQRLQGLEARLGLRLLDRFGRRTSLTDEGQLLAARARLILDEMDALANALGDRKNDMVGCLRIPGAAGLRQCLCGAAGRPLPGRSSLAVGRARAVRPPQPGNRRRLGHRAAHRRTARLDPATSRAGEEPAPAVRGTNLPRTPWHAAHGRRSPPPPLPDAARKRRALGLWRLRAPGGTGYEAVRIQPALSSNDGRVIKGWALGGYGIIQRSGWDVAHELRRGNWCRSCPTMRCRMRISSRCSAPTAAAARPVPSASSPC